jgi:hypothetical protein
MLLMRSIFSVKQRKTVCNCAVCLFHVWYMTTHVSVQDATQVSTELEADTCGTWLGLPES